MQLSSHSPSQTQNHNQSLSYPSPAAVDPLCARVARARRVVQPPRCRSARALHIVEDRRISMMTPRRKLPCARDHKGPDRGADHIERRKTRQRHMAGAHDERTGAAQAVHKSHADNKNGVVPGQQGMDPQCALIQSGVARSPRSLRSMLIMRITALLIMEHRFNKITLY